MKKFNEIINGSVMYVVDIRNDIITEVTVTDVHYVFGALSISYMIDDNICTVYVYEIEREWIPSQTLIYCTTLEGAKKFKNK